MATEHDSWAVGVAGRTRHGRGDAALTPQPSHRRGNNGGIALTCGQYLGEVATGPCLISVV